MCACVAVVIVAGGGIGDAGDVVEGVLVAVAEGRGVGPLVYLG